MYREDSSVRSTCRESSSWLLFWGAPIYSIRCIDIRVYCISCRVIWTSWDWIFFFYQLLLRWLSFSIIYLLFEGLTKSSYFEYILGDSCKSWKWNDQRLLEKWWIRIPEIESEDSCIHVASRDVYFECSRFSFQWVRLSYVWYFWIQDRIWVGRSVIIITSINSNRRDRTYATTWMIVFYDRVWGCISSRWLSYSDVAIYSP